MKKFNLLAVALFATISMLFVACSSCSHKGDKKAEETVATKLIQGDRQYMKNIDRAYVYYESCYMFEGRFDTLATPTVVYLENVFQVVNKETNQPTVYIAHHDISKSSDMWETKVGSFWLGDNDMNEYEIKLTVEEAFAKAKKSSFAKPHSRFCTLRAEVGIKACNPQYIFGNATYGLLYVDAVTGDVSDVNPVFNNFKCISVEKDSVRIQKDSIDD